MTLFEIDWLQAWNHTVYLLVAYALALPIGWERELQVKTAGLRTFPLVAVASCAYTIAGVQFLSTTDAESRIFQALITGMGFIGGGAILKVQEKGIVSGTATAASLWVTGAIGMSVAANFLELAIVLSFLTFITLRVLRFIKRQHDEEAQNA